MYLLGDALTKALAAVAALLTVFTGLPHVRCVCPDGRVRLFCPGSSHTGCCCTQARSNAGGTTADASCCAEADVPNRTPDAGGLEGGSAPSCADGAFVGKPCGCKRTLVADAGASVAEEVGGAERFEHDSAVWGALPVFSVSAFFARRVPPRLLPPPDLVVRFCHFTC